MRRHRDYACERKANWRQLSPSQLRRVMAGLFSLEIESRQPAVRRRLRRRRLEAAAVYRSLHGELTDDRFWVAAKAPLRRGLGMLRLTDVGMAGWLLSTADAMTPPAFTLALLVVSVLMGLALERRRALKSKRALRVQRPLRWVRAERLALLD